MYTSYFQRTFYYVTQLRLEPSHLSLLNVMALSQIVKDYKRLQLMTAVLFNDILANFCSFNVTVHEKSPGRLIIHARTVLSSCRLKYAHG